MSRRLLIVALALLLAVGSGCSRNEAGDKVRGLLGNAQGISLAFLYRETTQDGQIEVRGLIEDSFRHQESLLFNGQPVLERVIYDDSIAVKVLDPSKLSQAGVPQDAEPSVVESLRSGQWLLDPVGAPPVTRTSQFQPKVGVDPFGDALGIVKYLTDAIGQAQDVRLFNPDALDYRPALDPFPRPNKKAGETRYDVVRPPLPRREDQRLPRTAPFRKLSFYSKDGRLVRVMEEVNIEKHEEIVRARTTGRPQFIFDMVKALREGRGEETIRERTMEWSILTQTETLIVGRPTGVVTTKLGSLFAVATESSTQQIPQAPAVPQT